LLMEIMARTKRMQWDNMQELVDQLLARYGSAENAVVAIKSGIVGFEKIE
jgi:hypothetical protein